MSFDLEILQAGS